MKIKKYWKLIIGIAGVTGILNLLSLSDGFVEIYIRQVYSRIADIYGGLTSRIPFALGEFLMYLAMGLVALEAALLAVFFLGKLVSFISIYTGNQKGEGSECSHSHGGKKEICESSDISGEKQEILASNCVSKEEQETCVNSDIFGQEKKTCKNSCRRRNRREKFIIIYSKGLFLIVLLMLLCYTLNWSIPFRYELELEPGAGAEYKSSSSTEVGSDTFTESETESGLGSKSEAGADIESDSETDTESESETDTESEPEAGTEREYTLDDLRILRDYIVEKTNECAKEIGRDADGNIIYSEDVDEEIVLAMRQSAGQFGFLAGAYPVPKAALCSDFLDWMGIAGYTYPYTMEVTYNKYTMPLYYPALIAHEFSHHKGYYREDDANFISEIVCLNSESVYLNYSGCLDAYYYLNKAYKSALFSQKDAETARQIWSERAVFSEQVKADFRSNREIYEAAYAADGHAAQSLSSAAESVSEVGWNVQSDILKEDNYDGVVFLLLQYFDGTL